MKKRDNVQEEFNNPAKSSPNVKEIKEEKKPARKAEKKRKRSKRNSVLFVALQGVLSVLFLGVMFALGILPFSYAMIVTAVVAFLFAITWWSQKRKKTGRIIGRIYSIFIVLILLIVGSVMGVANYVLNEVTGAPFDVKEESFDIMSLGAMFSISEDPFCVYVQDMKDDADTVGGITVEGAENVQLLLSVNTENHQLLAIATPGEYLVTIPGVTSGQKELLGLAGKHGVEASVAALSNLYETKIPYYLKVDTKWIWGLKDLTEIFDGGFSYDVVSQLIEDILHIDKRIQTNMKKSEVQELIKMQIVGYEPWNTQMTVADGTPTESFTYSSPDEEVAGISPNVTKVKEIIGWIEKMEDGEILRDVNPIVLE